MSRYTLMLALAVCCCYSYYVDGTVLTNTSKQRNCDKQSKHWVPDNYDGLQSKCDALSFDKQYCMVEDKSQWDCMIKRAMMHDVNSCKCLKEYSLPDVHCFYAEICAFADPSFNCSTDYKCSVRQDGNISCTGPGLQPYENKCIRGLLHCPSDDRCHFFNLSASFVKLVEDDCGSLYQEMFGTGKTVYYIDRIHKNGTSLNYSNITVIMNTPGDEGNPCLKPSTDTFSESVGESWITLLVALFSILVSISILVCFWVLHRRRASSNRWWKSVIEETADYLHDFLETADNTCGPMNQVAEDAVPVSFLELEVQQSNDCSITGRENTKDSMAAKSDAKVGDELPDCRSSISTTISEIKPEVTASDSLDCSSDKSDAGNAQACCLESSGKSDIDCHNKGKVYENSSYLPPIICEAGYIKKCDPSLVCS